ncbi:MAG: hypothetical protein ACYSU2_17655 [Planctomycetota bacterium]|jgi:hypothetical protein
MDDAALVGGVERLGDLARRRQRQLERQGPALEPCRDRAARSSPGTSSIAMKRSPSCSCSP